VCGEGARSTAGEHINARRQAILSSMPLALRTAAVQAMNWRHVRGLALLADRDHAFVALALQAMRPMVAVRRRHTRCKCERPTRACVRVCCDRSRTRCSRMLATTRSTSTS
jgi:hypothetical protein